ncbi:MAG: hypothetical protein ABR549_08415 [Mycobacteriales bacterium]
MPWNRRRPRSSAFARGAVWESRTITLIADRPEVERICLEWQAEDWKVITVDEGPPTASGHVTHVVRVAVPPRGWISDQRVLAELDLER